MYPSRLTVPLLGLALALTPVLAQSTKERVRTLEEKVGSLETTLETRLAALEQKLAALDAMNKRLAQLENRVRQLQQQRAGQPQVDQAAEQKARRLYEEITRHLAAGETDAARAKMQTLQSEFAGTRTASAARRLQAELSVFGKPAPANLGIETWFQGEGDVDLSGAKPTLIVFWEVWCPHCRREVPKIEALYEKYRERGLQVIGLTKLTRSSTPEKVRAFISENGLAYPIAKEDGTASQYFQVSGIPAAAFVKDGKVVWRGHPARLTEAMLEKWL